MNKELPPYSSLIPVAPWESPITLAKSLASIREQTHPCSDLVICIDGPCSDIFKEVIENNIECHYTLLQASSNLGVGPTLARGLTYCYYDYVMRVDADDICTPNRAVEQLSYMINHPEVAVLSSPLAEFEADSCDLLGIRNVPPYTAKLQMSTVFRNPINHPAAFFRKEIILSVGNYRSVPGFEDYDLWLRVLKRGYSLANLSRPVVFARVDEQHRRRRHGVQYALNEVNFYLLCAHNKTLSWYVVLLVLVLRVPIRFLPYKVFTLLMNQYIRTSSPFGAQKLFNPN